MLARLRRSFVASISSKVSESAGQPEIGGGEFDRPFEVVEFAIEHGPHAGTKVPAARAWTQRSSTALDVASRRSMGATRRRKLADRELRLVDGARGLQRLFHLGGLEGRAVVEGRLGEVGQHLRERSGVEFPRRRSIAIRSGLT